jgi:hypothetical protein
MKRTVIESASLPSKTGQPDIRCSLWPRIVQALASPAAWWASLGMLMVYAVLYLAICFLPLAGLHNSASPVNQAAGWGNKAGMTCNWYLNRRQLRADLHTTFEVVRYVLSPDLDYSGSPVRPSTMPYLSATTNWGTNMPRV